jgi:ABC-2 type transport system ATP-binding protein
MTAVDVASLSVVRGGQVVLDGVGFSLERGSLTGLVGPSGSGKTTLMRCLVGVQAHISGDVTVLGLPAGHRDLRDRVGYLTQAPSVYDDLTVRDNLRFFAALLGAPPSAVATALADVELSDMAKRRVDTLSGGQRARVSLATALLGRPELLVLDEPTVGLDPVLRAELWGLFHRLADGGATLLVSSHVMDEAGRCERVLLLRDGHLLADETPDGLRGRTGTDDLDAAFLRLVDTTAAAS